MSDYRQWWIYQRIQQLCGEEEVGFVDLYVGRADMFTRDGVHPSGKGAAVFADEFSVGFDSGINNIFGSRY